MTYNACYSAVSFMVLSSSESSGINFITESGVQCNILNSFSSDKRVMFEPWMLRTIEDEPGTVDFKLREKVECGDSIMNRNMIGLLATLMEAKLQDF